MPSVKLLLPEGGLAQWHRALLSALLADGYDGAVDWRPCPRRLTSILCLEVLERLILARHRAPLLEPVEAGEWLRLSSRPAEFVIDLSGRPDPEPGSIFPTYNHELGEDALDLALLEEPAPQLGLAKREGNSLRYLAQAVVARESPALFCSAREAICRRLTTLIRMSLRRDTANFGLPSAPSTPTAHKSTPGAFLATSLAARVNAKLSSLLGGQDVWRVAWRSVLSDTEFTTAALRWPDAAWTMLPDDRQRYYADPFLFEHEGSVHVFCEEYPYATAKAVISHFELDAHGRASGPPRVVLERPVHLSYPYVFRHDGQIWMMPESCGARNLELYRADPFPHRWVPDRLLIDDLEISDATVLERDGRYWLTATTNEDGGSSWDCLSTFVGTSPVGPWRRCYRGPALVDASAARPAGRAFERNGELWRPAQDCTSIYGGGLALCRIDQLDEDGFQQRVMSRLGAPAGLGAKGAHTLNTVRGYEAIDLFGRRSG